MEEASDPGEPGREVAVDEEKEAWAGGGEEARGGMSGGEARKKSDGTCSFIRPFTPVATATCLEGTPERRRRWQKKQRSRQGVGGSSPGSQAQPNQTASIRPGLQHQEEEQGEEEEEQ